MECFNKYGILSAIVFSVLALFSCKSEVTEAEEGTDNVITLRVDSETMSRTSLKDTGTGVSVNWAEGDKLYVFNTIPADMNNLAEFILVSGAGSKTATFRGTVSGPADRLYAVYGDKSCLESHDRGIKFELNNSKFVTTPSGLAPYDVLYGMFEKQSGDIYKCSGMKHGGALLKFRVGELTPGAKIKQVALTGNANVCHTIIFRADMSAINNIDIIGATQDVVYKNDNGIAVGEDGIATFHVILAPKGQGSGDVTLTLTMEDGSTVVKTLSYNSITKGKSYTVNIGVEVPEEEVDGSILNTEYAKVDSKYLSLNMVDMISQKEGYKNGDAADVRYVNGLISKANGEIEANKSYTIVNKPFFPPGVNPNDYVSVSPYKWPNPDTESGYPYISKDGQINPESRTKYTDQKNISAMISAVQNLGLAYYYTEDARYAQRIEAIVKEFFINPETKMNPHLEYGQCTPTQSKPSGTAAGLIETAGLGQMLEGFTLASEKDAISQETVDGLKDWVSKYLDWCDTSRIGIADRNGKQNHATHYDRQTTSYRLFLGKYNGTDYIAKAKTYLKTYTYKRLTQQIKEDGSQPEELRRTKSWNYTNMNMKGFYQIAIMAEKIGVDLWYYKGGRTVPPLKKVIDWFLPYLAKENAWSWKQIQKEPVSKIEWCLEIAAQRYNDQKYLDAIDNFQTIHENIVK